MAQRLYEFKKDLEFRRVTFSKTSLQPATWKDCPSRERLEWQEAVKLTLADPEIIQALMNRAAGL